MSILSSSTIVSKQPSEVIKVGMDFSNWLDTGITISDPIVTSEFYGCATTDLIFAGITVVGQTIQMFVSGGTDGNRYRVSIKVNTSGGEILQGDGILEVTER